MDAAGDGLHIMAERRRKPQPLRSHSARRWRARLRRDRLRRRLAKRVKDAAGRNCLFWRSWALRCDCWFGRRRRRFLLFDVPPLGAPRSLAAAAARALRISEWQPHLEREIRAHEVWEVGAVGAKDHLHRVFAEIQMVEQEIARWVAQHLM